METHPLLTQEGKAEIWEGTKSNEMIDCGYRIVIYYPFKGTQSIERKMLHLEQVRIFPIAEKGGHHLIHGLWAKTCHLAHCDLQCP